MSSFICEQCGATILDTRLGYITGCSHYPLEDTKKPPQKGVVVAQGVIDEYGYLDGIFCPIGRDGEGKRGKLIFMED